MIEQFYLTQRWDSISPGHSGPDSKSNYEVLHIPQRPGLEPQHQILFTIIPRTQKYIYV